MGIANINLKIITDQRGWGPSDLVRLMKRTPSFWSDRLRNRHNIGAMLAREIEDHFGLPRYWLDEDHTGAPITSASPLVATKNQLTIAALLEQLAVRLDAVSPLLRDAARQALAAYFDRNISSADAARTIDALLTASKTMPKSGTPQFESCEVRDGVRRPVEKK